MLVAPFTVGNINPHGEMRTMAGRKSTIKKKKVYGGCWPTTEQELLLRACLASGDEAVSAYEEWKSSVDMDGVDPGSYRLFPILYKNLKSIGIDDPLLHIFGWVYEKTFDNNCTLYDNLSTFLKNCKEHGIDVILLKGSALALLYYKDYGLRPMMDADLLVRIGEARRMIRLITELGWQSSITPLKGFGEKDLLSKLGWTPAERRLEDYSDEYFSIRHGQDFNNSSLFTIDLHWHVLHGYNDKDADRGFWNGARTVEVNGAAAMALYPADQLLHVCSHGVRWDLIPPIRWIADAAAVVNETGDRMDWGRLTEASRQHGKVLQLREALRYLRRYVGDSVPGEVVEELDAVPVNGAERFQFSVRTRPPGILDGIVELGFLYSNYSRVNRRKNFFNRIAGFPKFLQHVLGMDSTWHLVLYSTFELVRRGSEVPGALLKKFRSG